MSRFITLHLQFLSLAIRDIVHESLHWRQNGINTYKTAAGFWWEEEGRYLNNKKIQWSIQLCKITLRLVLIIFPLSSFNLKQENTYDLFSVSERRTSRNSISALHSWWKGFFHVNIIFDSISAKSEFTFYTFKKDESKYARKKEKSHEKNNFDRVN